MDQPHLPRKARQEAPHGLRGQGDLRHQDDGLFAQAQRLIHRAHVNFGFPRAGDAVQQVRR